MGDRDIVTENWQPPLLLFGAETLHGGAPKAAWGHAAPSGRGGGDLRRGLGDARLLPAQTFPPSSEEASGLAGSGGRVGGWTGPPAASVVLGTPKNLGVAASSAGAASQPLWGWCPLGDAGEVTPWAPSQPARM